MDFGISGDEEVEASGGRPIGHASPPKAGS